MNTTQQLLDLLADSAWIPVLPLLLRLRNVPVDLEVSEKTAVLPIGGTSVLLSR